MRVREPARRSTVARLAGVAGVLVLAGVAVAIIALASHRTPEAPFEAEAFRGARLTRDTGALRTQAQRAVSQHALEGMTAKQLRATLGEPTRRYRRTARMVWQVGGWNLSGSPGEGLEVRLDRDSGRAVTVRLDPPPEYDD